MLELHHSSSGIFAHIFYCILIAKPVGAFNSIVHMPAPIILSHIAECSANPTLRDDVAFCAQRDIFNLVAAMQANGALRKI